MTRRHTSNFERYLCLMLILGTAAASFAVWHSLSAHPVKSGLSVPANSIVQSSRVVGMGIGARQNLTDPGLLEFAEITNADQFDFRQEFEFEKLVLRVAKVFQVKDPPPNKSGSRL